MPGIVFLVSDRTHRHRHQERTDAAQNRQRPMHAQFPTEPSKISQTFPTPAKPTTPAKKKGRTRIDHSLVHGYSHLDHPARRHIPDQRDTRQRTGRKALIAINHILIATDKDTQNPIPEQHARQQRRPIRHPLARRPAHPEQSQRDRRRAQHAEPQPELGGEAGAAVGSDAGEVAERPAVDEGNEEGGGAETEGDTEEGEAGEALGEAVSVGEDEGVAVEEGEEDDVDNGEIERDEDDDRFGGGEQEGPVQRCAKAADEGLGADLDGGAVAGVAGDGAEVGGFPLQQHGRVGFGLEGEDEDEDEGADDEGEPFAPAPTDAAGLADEAADHEAEDRAEEGGVGEDGEGVDALHGGPEVGDGPARAGEGRGAEEAGEEAERELGADVGG